MVIWSFNSGERSLAGWLFQMGFLCEVSAEEIATAPREVAACLFGPVGGLQWLSSGNGGQGCIGIGLQVLCGG